MSAIAVDALMSDRLLDVVKLHQSNTLRKKEKTRVDFRMFLGQIPTVLNQTPPASRPRTY